MDEQKGYLMTSRKFHGEKKYKLFWRESLELLEGTLGEKMEVKYRKDFDLPPASP